jgi:hypothetical protein
MGCLGFVAWFVLPLMLAALFLPRRVLDDGNFVGVLILLMFSSPIGVVIGAALGGWAAAGGDLLARRLRVGAGLLLGGSVMGALILTLMFTQNPEYRHFRRLDSAAVQRLDQSGLRYPNARFDGGYTSIGGGLGAYTGMRGGLGAKLNSPDSHQTVIDYYRRVVPRDWRFNPGSYSAEFNSKVKGRRWSGVTINWSGPPGCRVNVWWDMPLDQR